MASNVLRELLPCPLPFPNAGGPAPASSRSVQRRHHRKTHWQAWCNEGVATLNEMYGHGTIDNSAVEATPSAAQSSCLARLTAAYCHMGRPPDAYASAAGAFSELCSAPAGYSDAVPAAGKPVPYQSGRVSIPSAGNAPADPSHLLGGEDLLNWQDWRRRLLVQPDAALHAQRESGLEKPYCDRSLVASQARYGEFIDQLLSCEIITLCKRAPTSVGIFFCLQEE